MTKKKQKSAGDKGLFSCLNCFSAKSSKGRLEVEENGQIKEQVKQSESSANNNSEDEAIKTWEIVRASSQSPDNTPRTVSPVKDPQELYLEICKKCGLLIPIKEEVLNDGEHWHSGCFRCKDCGGSLVNQKYFEKGPDLFCTACFHAKLPKCRGCKQLIISGGLQLQGEGDDSFNWHQTCLQCSRCHISLKKENLRFKDDLFCPACFTETFSQRCGSCKKPILNEGLQYKEEMFHETCFTCDICMKPLKDQKFVPRDGQKVCPLCYIQDQIET